MKARTYTRNNKTIQGIVGLFILGLLFFITGCGGGGNGDTDDILTTQPNINLHAYQNNPYAKLLTCSKSTDCAECSLTDLPFITDTVQTKQVTVDDIMSHVVVTHDWMGNNFKQVLQALPSDLLQLFAPVRAINISYNNRPSAYYPATSTIFIDPLYLYLTSEQLSDVDRTPDPRSEYGQTLQFTWLWRYMDQGKSIRFSLAQTRQLADIIPSIAAMLVHELAHANDFFTYDRLPEYTQLDQMCTVLNQLQPVSTDLMAQYPLTSSQLSGLASVSFKGETANDAQTQLTPQQVWDAFMQDSANEYYNYTNQREDLAMLFEESMLLHYFGYQREVMIMPQPEEDISARTVPITAGAGSRIADAGPKNRATFVLSRLLVNAEPVLNTLNATHSYTLPAGITESDSNGHAQNTTKQLEQHWQPLQSLSTWR